MGGKAVSGTSEAGIITPVRPGEDRSKMVGSTIFTFFPFALSGAPWAVFVCSIDEASLIMAHLRKGLDESINIFLAIHLGHRDQHVILERGIILAKIVSAENAVLEQMRVDFCNRAIDAQRKLVEEWLGETQAHTIDLAELRRGVVCLLITKLSNLLQSVFAKQ